jgi:DNA-binding NarL/FixJ family response regulator
MGNVKTTREQLARENEELRRQVAELRRRVDGAERARAPGPGVLRVLVADDYALVREGLKRILSETADLVVAGEAATRREALEQVRGGSFDVVVLDLSMSGWDGLGLLKEILASGPKPPVLVMSVYPEEQFAARAIKAGAMGYVTKDTVLDEIVLAIRAVGHGKRYLSRRLTELFADRLSRPAARDAHERLSDRELDVFRHLAQGKRLKEIAARLHLSEKTITTHRRNILDKMNLENNAELVQYAIAHRLVP